MRWRRMRRGRMINANFQPPERLNQKNQKKKKERGRGEGRCLFEEMM